MAGHIDHDTPPGFGESFLNYIIPNHEHLSVLSNNVLSSSYLSASTKTVAQDARITPPPPLPLELRQNNPQDCSNLIIASVDRATVEISRTIIALNATFSQQLKAASSSATSGINSAQSSANKTISIAFSNVTIANRIATSANVALTSAQSSASTALSIANSSIAVVTQSLFAVNLALATAQGNITSLSSASSSDISRLSSASSSDVARLSASLTLLQASVLSVQASASAALEAAQLALASVTGSAAAQASAILASAAPIGQPLTLQSSRITPGLIAAITVGGVIILLLLLGISFFVLTKMRKRKQDNSFLTEKIRPLSPALEPERIEPPLATIALATNIVGNTGADTTYGTNSKSNGNIGTTKFIPRKSSESPRPTKSALRKKRQDSVVIPPPDISDIEPFPPEFGNASLELVEDSKENGTTQNTQRMTLDNVTGFPNTDVTSNFIDFSNFQLSPPVDKDHNKGEHRNAVTELEMKPLSDPIEATAVQPPVLSTSVVISDTNPRFVIFPDPQSNPFEDSSTLPPTAITTAIKHQSIPFPDQEAQNWLQPISRSPTTSKAINNYVSRPAGYSPEPDFETEYHRYLDRQQRFSEQNLLFSVPKSPRLVEPAKVYPSPQTPPLGEAMNPGFSRAQTPVLSDDDPDRTSTMPEIDAMLRIVARENEETADQPLFWSDFRAVDPEVEEILASMAAQETTMPIPEPDPMEDRQTSLTVSSEPAEIFKEQVVEPEISQPVAGPEIVLPTIEKSDEPAFDIDRGRSPHRQNSQIRNISSILLEQEPIFPPKPQDKPFEPITSLDTLPDLLPPPPIPSRAERGRSMLRTSDILEARSSYLAAQKASNKSTLNLKLERDRTSSPLRRNPVDRSQIPVPARDKTVSPQRKGSLSNPRSMKRSSRSLSPPRATPVIATSLIDRTESPLRRNPLPAAQTSLSSHTINRTASPLRLNPSTTPPPTSQAPALPNPTRISRSISQPRPNSTAFNENLSKFRSLATQNPGEARQASTEVAQRAQRGIYIPGSLREQAIRNVSRGREGGRER